MDQDSKSTALKDLQGRIWEEGYKTGELIGEVFEDIAPALNRWRAQGIGVGIFSSGSVLAQKLLFQHSSAGDLTPFLRWHFDTTVGAKTDAESYRRIASIDWSAALERPLHFGRGSGARCSANGRRAHGPVPQARQPRAAGRSWPSDDSQLRRSDRLIVYRSHPRPGRWFSGPRRRLTAPSRLLPARSWRRQRASACCPCSTARCRSRRSPDSSSACWRSRTSPDPRR